MLIKAIVALMGILVSGQLSAQVVYAGEDTSICPGETLTLSELSASITGGVDEGTWFSLGDGYFTPGNSNTVSFLVAETYVPGPGDINNGWFTLLLASNYGQAGQATDMVNISFQTAPALACNTSLNISLTDNCTQLITPEIVLANPSKPTNRYNITMKDENNQLVVGNILTKEHIGQTISFGVSHDCDPLNSCWGEIRVEDKNPPMLVCKNDTLKCTASISPDSIGFPVGDGVVLERLSNNKWAAYGLDACTDATLSYQDEVMVFPCYENFEKVIFRTWRANDEYNNTISCIEEIYIRKDSINGVIMPPNYNNIDLNALECGSNYAVLPDGHPHPDFTGYPTVINCNNLQATFDDVEFDICGGGIKILRNWLVIDWCTSESREHNQIIKVEDSTPPEFDCPDDITVETVAYSCVSRSFLIPENLNITDCSEVNMTWTVKDSFDRVIVEGNNNYVAELPIGTHVIEYIVRDVCGNADTCEAFIYVIDKIAPQAVCDEFTSIALGIDGTARLYAESVDDGSHDNCSIVSMEVAKMTDDCGNELLRGPYVEFCCAEAGKTVMVAFTVTDGHGNENTCMVTVEVEDKLPPQITCPPNLTISCRNSIDFDDLSPFGKVALPGEVREEITIHDGYNSGVVGIDGFTTDNCDVSVEESHTKDLECGQGVITRTFTATDNGGLISTCVQIITVLDEDPFEYNDIDWPDDYYDVTCVDTAISPDISFWPEFLNDHCASLATTYKDKFFPFADGACMKIIREWTVVDWCQYNDKTSEGLWTYNQVLKFDNVIAPVIENLCQDSLICLFDEECMTTRYTTSILVSDDCTHPDDIDYFWTYDENNDGIVDITGTSAVIDINTIIGIHHIEIRVEDRCGNNTYCVYDIEVKDCKAPTPHCISEVTTVLMDTNNEIEIWASDFDFNSYDNCTDQEDLVFSFDKDTLVKSFTLTCDNIPNGISGNVDLDMWITDEAGNQEFCSVTVHVQDNNDNCADKEVPVMVSGNIQTILGTPVSGVVVDLETSSSEYNAQFNTAEEGLYAFDNIPGHLMMDIKPSLLDEPDKGVSTLDIVHIQRHILGFKALDNITKEIAADVNGSGSITGTDLVVIRKLILGKFESFPNGIPAWKFYDKSIEITEENMRNLPGSISFNSLADDVFDADFIGIKMGDVDDTMSKIREGITSQRENKNREISAQVVSERGVKVLDLFLEEDCEFQGFQLALLLPYSEDGYIVNSMLPEFSASNYHYDGEVLRLSWSSDRDYAIDAGNSLFNVMIPENVNISVESITLSSEYLSSEFYMNYQAFPLVLSRKNEKVKTDVADLKIRTNPFRNALELTLDSQISETAFYSISDASGRLISNSSYQVLIGKNELVIDENVFPHSGVFFLNVRMKGWNKSLKLIKID
jgi:hypothetical protein